MPLLPALLMAAPDRPPQARACSATELVAGLVADVRRGGWPDYPHGPVPDAATMAGRRAGDFADLRLDPVAGGLEVTSTREVTWPARICSVEVVGMIGGGAITRQGVVLSVTDHVRIDAPGTPAGARDLPAHPILDGARFVASSSIVSGDWRIGLWQFPDHSLLAAYRPGGAEAPRPLLRAAVPVIDLGYLPSPDTGGGLLTLLQRVAPGQYRWTYVSWNEAGLR